MAVASAVAVEAAKQSTRRALARGGRAGVSSRQSACQRARRIRSLEAQIICARSPAEGCAAVQSVRLVVTTDHGSRINFRGHGHGGSTACLRKKVSKVGKQLISFSC
eukprot:SAG25_NODE_246_length_11082_cov_5.118001_11_plen_107_part_00